MFVIDYSCVGECTEIFSVFTSCLHQNLCTEKYIYIDRMSCVLKCIPAFAVDVAGYPKCRNLQNQNKSVGWLSLTI